MICPKCGFTASARDHFCENCGSPLREGAAPPSAAPVLTCHCPPGQSKPDEAGYCEVCGVRCVAAPAPATKQVVVSVDGQLAVVSDVGRRHPVNEDTGLVARGPDNLVALIVADGVSLSTDSASASHAAVAAAMSTLLAAPTGAVLADVMRAAVIAANEAVVALPLPPRDEEAPETTIVAALCRGGRVAIGWAGDSRAYLTGADGIEQLTVDDSWVEQAVRGGEMSREQALADKRSHYVTQVLGMRDQELDPHVIERDLPGDRALLLCSDGLWNYFPQDGELADALHQADAKDAVALCHHLVDLANERGGHDNVTVAILLGHA